MYSRVRDLYILYIELQVFSTVYVQQSQRPVLYIELQVFSTVYVQQSQRPVYTVYRVASLLNV